MERKEYDKKVRAIRKALSPYHYGRRCVVLNQYTERAKGIIASARHSEGECLSDVYGSPSISKRNVYNELWEMYCQDKNAFGFSICSHNTFSFTVSWCDGEYLYFFTPQNEYIVVINK